jgi:hypothetical protein
LGSYHIYKNITINKDYTLKTDTDGWLNCCAGYLDPLPREPAFISFISADNVFSIKKFK